MLNILHITKNTNNLANLVKQLCYQIILIFSKEVKTNFTRQVQGKFNF